MRAGKGGGGGGGGGWGGGGVDIEERRGEERRKEERERTFVSIQVISCSIRVAELALIGSRPTSTPMSPASLLESEPPELPEPERAEEEWVLLDAAEEPRSASEATRVSAACFCSNIRLLLLRLFTFLRSLSVAVWKSVSNPICSVSRADCCTRAEKSAALDAFERCFREFGGIRAPTTGLGFALASLDTHC